MTTTQELDEFYTQCMSCDNSREKCPEIEKDFNKGCIPRGFYYRCPQIKVLAVAKNPGSFQNDEEKLYAKKTERERFKAHRELMKNLFENPNLPKKSSNRFHRNLKEDLSHFLDLRPDEVFTQTAFTNLVKCSTKNEQEKLRNYPTARDSCFEKFFLKELNLLKPRVVLALSKEVYDFLNEHEAELKVRNACLICIKHPAYPYREERKKVVFCKVKEHIKDCLSVPDSFCKYDYHR